MSSTINDQIFDAYRRLDHETILQFAKVLKAAENDRDRVALAFAHMAKGERETAEYYITRFEGDDSVPEADRAYVKAFQAELDNDHQKVVELLGPHMEDEQSTHGARLRLRVADACNRLEMHQRTVKALEPLLSPPGVPETLEAHLILMEALLDSGAEQEKLIEEAAVIDALLERGFRLKDAANVSYYAELLQHYQIEAVIERLLNSHEAELSNYLTEDPEEIRFLLTAGQKYKAPGAIRAAARSYAKDPFEWGDELDGEKLAYTFSSHDEHRAARATIYTSFPEKEIHERQAVWGPLILSCYFAGEYQEALDLIQRHRNEIPKLQMADNAAMIRSVCEFNIGRFGEALDTARAMGDKFYKEAAGHEATVIPRALLRLGKLEEIANAFKEAIAAESAKEDKNYQNIYFNQILHDCYLYENLEWLKAVIGGLAEVFPASNRPMMLKSVAETAMEWAMPEAVDFCIEHLEEYHTPLIEFLKALRAANLMETEAMETHFAKALDDPDKIGKEHILLYRARWRRRHKRYDEALADVDAILANEDYPRRHAPLAINAGILTDSGNPASRDIHDLRRQIDEFIQKKAESREMAAMLLADSRHFYEGDRPEAMLQAAERTEKQNPGVSESVRLARKAAKAPDAPKETTEKARGFIRAWFEKNKVL